MFLKPLHLLALLCAIPLSGCGPTVATSNQSTSYRGNGLVADSAAHAGQLNALRVRHGLAPVRPNATLERVAAAHANDMIEKGFFGHISSDGGTIVTRTRAQGYRPCNINENLAKGHARFGDLLTTWMRSSSHRANLLSNKVVEFGLVRATDGLWVLVMGRPGC